MLIQAAGRDDLELFGPVVMSPTSPFFLGADQGSNNTGELCAVLEALHWMEAVRPAELTVLRAVQSWCLKCFSGV